MDFRVNNVSKLKKFPRPGDGLRALAERAPSAEAFAISWIDWTRPVWSRIYALRRRAATAAVFILAFWLFVHVVFGANGMVVYRQKRAEREELQKQINQLQDENNRYSRQIQDLKSNQQAIEKEAREQLHYARPGEYVYVNPNPASPTPAGNHSAKNK
jgi:cell division protein FtsB